MKRILISFAVVLCLAACDEPAPLTARSGVQQASVRVEVGSDGITAEQRNIRDRLVEDNKPGAIKHLYVISAYSGQVLIYSTVRGKVTSGGKRLSAGNRICWSGQAAGVVEAIGDDGAFGSSMEYVYWWDTKGVYHQHYVQGGQILHISSEPLAVKSVVLNMELSASDEK